jgi:predicted GNAT superfamily acetyltransferase
MTVVRPLGTQAEYDAAVALQERIWGANVGETVPACVLQVSQEVGGIADGAFSPGGDLVGIVFGLTGLRNGKLAHWSHLLAVDDGWRDRGIGRLLKAHQRETLLKTGVDSMFWTFDPLESRNAHLNLNTLGVTVEAYVPDFYGATSVAKTDTVIGTDRFVVRWDLAGSPTPSNAKDLVLNEIPCVTARPHSEDSPHSRGIPPVSGRFVRVEIPANIQALKSSDPTSAAAWRETTRHALVHYLGAGYRIAEFRPNSEGPEGCYILETS